jgi:transposase-like protein
MFEFKSVLEFNKKFATENKCFKALVKIRFGKIEKAHCLYCKHNKVSFFKKEERFKCSKCNKKFSIKVGTIFEGSKLGLTIWFKAIYMLTNSAKGVSSNQLAKELDITQKSAWFVLNRLRHIAKTNFSQELLENEVEIDEGFIGGSETNKHTEKKFTTTKAPIIGMVQRSGNAKAMKLESMKVYDIQDKIYDNVKEGSTIYTDANPSYKMLNWNYKHQAINHSKKEFRKGKAYTSGVEGFFGLVKKNINGTFHWISKKHIDKYLSEITYRYNVRLLVQSKKFENFVNNLSGRLTYNQLIAK